mmetsp:Transcript_37207/g.115741  ORF Transcript_37207/g.115741 Transcript_37207/m.115741 type:complete len:213 (+) Transcript_37207:430-1068(+)
MPGTGGGGGSCGAGTPRPGREPPPLSSGGSRSMAAAPGDGRRPCAVGVPASSPLPPWRQLWPVRRTAGPLPAPGRPAPPPPGPPPPAGLATLPGRAGPGALLPTPVAVRRKGPCVDARPCCAPVAGREPGVGAGGTEASSMFSIFTALMRPSGTRTCTCPLAKSMASMWPSVPFQVGWATRPLRRTSMPGWKSGSLPFGTCAPPHHGFTGPS